MKLGIMQPYFFPYLGYFDLINRTDRWVVFDVVKYVPKSWMNRNRVLHPDKGWQYITVPVDKHHENGAIKDVRIIDKAGAHNKIRGQIEHYRRARAPHYSAVVKLIDSAFESSQSGLLRDLNVGTLRAVCEYLSIPFDPMIFSQMEMELPPIEHPGQWALEISERLGATTYINPPGGRAIFRLDEWKDRGIEIGFTEIADFTYDTPPYPFVEHLSIVDVLMWNEPGRVTHALDDLAKRPLT